MALCRHCSTVIPCHCHVPPPIQVRPGVYLASSPTTRARAAAVPVQPAAADTREDPS